MRDRLFTRFPLTNKPFIKFVNIGIKPIEIDIYEDEKQKKNSEKNNVYKSGQVTNFEISPHMPHWNSLP